MRADLGGYPDPAVLSPSDQLDGAAGAHVTEVDMTTGSAGKEDVPDRHDFLSLGRDALESQSRRDDALVHGAPLRQRHLLAVIGDRNAEGARVLERGAHEVRARDGSAVVAHGHGTGAHHFAELREGLAFLA